MSCVAISIKYKLKADYIQEVLNITCLLHTFLVPTTAWFLNGVNSLCSDQSTPITYAIFGSFFAIVFADRPKQ